MDGGFLTSLCWGLTGALLIPLPRETVGRLGSLGKKGWAVRFGWRRHAARAKGPGTAPRSGEGAGSSQTGHSLSH